MKRSGRTHRFFARPGKGLQCAIRARRHLPALLSLLASLSLFLAACELSPTGPVRTGGPATLTPADEAGPAATHTPLPPSTSTPTVLPATPVPTASPEPPTPAPPAEAYIVEDERQIGEYVVRLWRNTSSEGVGYDQIATISGAGQPPVQAEFVAGLGEETGTDLTGEGHPDVVIQVFTGGAHCCFSTIVYDLGPQLTKVLESPLSNCGGSFTDLDGDGVAEFVTCDDLFAYAYCPYAGSPAAQVVLQYEPGQGYVPASPRFAQSYDAGIAAHTAAAEEAQPGELGEWDGTNKCGVLPLVLDYLYSGQDGKAWSEFSRLYDHPDALLFWAEIRQALGKSPLYTPGKASAEVAFPPYYMLQLMPDCGPADMQQIVGVLQEGESGCGQALYRDIYWLQMRLQDAGLLKEGEMLTLTPEDCTDDCRLDVIRIAGNAPQGGIRLDTEVGFPGEVYRVDGEESGHWRLRGDLTWEQVPQ